MSAVEAAIISALKADAGVREVFGTPARVFDASSDAPYFPFVRLERHERRDGGASLCRGGVHTLQLAVMTRHTGMSGAREALEAVRKALEAAEWSVPGQNVVLAHVTYADTMRAPRRETWRGIVRLKLIIEEAG